MKVDTYIQYLGREVLVNDMERRIKEIWKESGGLVKDLKTVEVYVKVEENMCYYVINGNKSGGFPIEG